VVLGLSVRLTFTQPFVYVPQDYKATPLLHVLMQAVAVTMNVQQTKSVILPLVVDSHVRNVKPFVIQEIVPEGLIVQPKTTGKPVIADSH
jgi:hypothetical protein